jgi:type II secretory pathway pseudopilin PulG
MSKECWPSIPPAAPAAPRALGGAPKSMRTVLHRLRAATRARAAFSIIEVMLVLTILTVGIGMFAGTLGSVMGLGPSLRESARATESARSAVESLRALPFDQVWATYNADPADDPGGAGTAPGAAFDIAGLSPVPGDPDGRVGRIVFPELGGELREDVADDGLGTPRDLNLDGAVDGADHAGDYRVLPVLVRVEWKGKGPARQLDLHTTIAAP